MCDAEDQHGCSRREVRVAEVRRAAVGYEVDEMYNPNTLTSNGMPSGAHNVLVGTLYWPYVGCGFGRENVDAEAEKLRLIKEGPTDLENVERTRYILCRLQDTCQKHGFPIPSKPPSINAKWEADAEEYNKCVREGYVWASQPPTVTSCRVFYNQHMNILNEKRVKVEARTLHDFMNHVVYSDSDDESDTNYQPDTDSKNIPDWYRPQTRLLHDLGILYYNEINRDMHGWVKELLHNPGITAARILQAFSEDGWYMIAGEFDDEVHTLSQEIAPLRMESVLA